MAIASIVPSATAASSASASSREVSGGFTRHAPSYASASAASPLACQANERTPPTHSSVSARWCGVTSQVTEMPLALASRTASTDRGEERWVRCSAAPVSAASARSRRTTATSASAGHGRRPSLVAVGPARIKPPAPMSPSSGWSMRGRPALAVRVNTSRAASDPTDAPSSDSPAAPAAARACTSLGSNPARSRVAAPTTRTRHAAPRARARTAATASDESMGGSVFGMAHTVVNPPRAAARVPLSIVSAPLEPGWRRWTCRSQKPGASTRSRPSITSAPSTAVPVITPSAMATSRTLSVPASGSRTRAPLITRLAGASVSRPKVAPATPVMPLRRGGPGPPCGPARHC